MPKPKKRSLTLIKKRIFMKKTGNGRYNSGQHGSYPFICRPAFPLFTVPVKDLFPYRAGADGGFFQGLFIWTRLLVETLHVMNPPHYAMFNGAERQRAVQAGAAVPALGGFFYDLVINFIFHYATLS
jgi:hypothetical protein